MSLEVGHSFFDVPALLFLRLYIDSLMLALSFAYSRSYGINRPFCRWPNMYTLVMDLQFWVFNWRRIIKILLMWSF